MKYQPYYIAVSPEEIVIAVGEQAGLSLEDDYTVQGPESKYTVIKVLFKKIHQNDKKRMHKL